MLSFHNIFSFAPPSSLHRASNLFLPYLRAPNHFHRHKSYSCLNRLMQFSTLLICFGFYLDIVLAPNSQFLFRFSDHFLTILTLSHPSYYRPRLFAPSSCQTLNCHLGTKPLSYPRLVFDISHSIISVLWYSNSASKATLYCIRRVSKIKRRLQNFFVLHRLEIFQATAL